MTGRLPGVYQYSVTNRATLTTMIGRFTIEGKTTILAMTSEIKNHFIDGTPPTNLTAERTSLTTVLVNWTAPATPPSQGYQVLVTRGAENTTTNVSGTSHNISVNNQYGVYSIRVRSLSQHLPSDVTEQVDVTVKRYSFCQLVCVVTCALHCIEIVRPQVATHSLNATLVTITWTLNAQVVEYMITATPASRQMLCPLPKDEQSVNTSANTTNATITGLQEFSSYVIRISAIFQLLPSLTANASVELTTLSAGKENYA